MINPSDILSFLQKSPSPLTKREIARAFGIKGGENRVALKQVLKKLEAEGSIIKHPGGAYAVPDGLPAVSVIEVVDIDVDGDVFGRPLDWDETRQGPAPRIEIAPGGKGHPALKPGDRALSSLRRTDDKSYEAKVIRPLDSERGRVVGVLRLTKSGPVLEPADKKMRYDFPIKPGDEGAARDGDLIVGEIQPSRDLKQKRVRVIDILGRRDDPKAISLISLYECGLHEKFPDAAIKDCEGMKVPPLEKREDMRAIPLVTIDGADARDFDDAVFAEPCVLPDSKDGYHLIVAIADVSFYVRPGTALDREALVRGNSTYFPDRVVPMLPEALSNDLCSLRPNEDRAALAVHMWIDERGQMIKHKFVRALIRSHARLTYEQVQAARDGLKDSKTQDLMKDIIPNLYDAYRILDKARAKRGALDLDVPERQILIDKAGNMTGVQKRMRLDSHKLIEEFMILANVAAAQALESAKTPCVYRIHDRPSMDKLEGVREFIESFGLSMPRGQTINPAQINGLLRQAAEMPYSPLISQVILRTQSQAVYSPKNIGHFGLALERYAHFTSPIRRYADLLVHRALVRAYGLGPGGLSEEEEVQLEAIASDISGTERKSMEAERSATDRFTASYLSGHVGAIFAGRISGVTRFGLFVTLDESGADGLIPMKSMGDDFYIHDEKAHALIGRRRGKVYRLGANVQVRLKEADGLTGSTLLELTGESLKGADIPGMARPKIHGGGKGDRPKSKNSPHKSGKFKKDHKKKLNIRKNNSNNKQPKNKPTKPR
jgi:ribonuclease R